MHPQANDVLPNRSTDRHRMPAMTRILLVVLLAPILAGCDRASELLMPAADKVTKAFPLPDDLQLAAGRLLNPEDVKSSAVAESGESATVLAWKRQLKLRALTCAPAEPIRWWHSVAAVRSLPFDRACLRSQDDRLSEWVGIQRVSRQLRMGPLVPMADLGERRLLLGVTALAQIHGAPQANVAVVKDSRGRFSAMDLTTGRLLRALDASDAAETGVEVSPNGRLVAIPASSRKGMRILDVESGSLIWKTEQFSGVVAWLPELDAAIVNPVTGSGWTLLDLRTGKDQSYLDSSVRMSWAVPAPEPGSTLWLIGANTAIQVSHRRNAAGELESTAQTTWSLQRQVTSLRPLLMQSGKRLLYITVRDLAWVDLQNGEQGVYEFSALNGHGYAKLDEKRLLFDIGGTGSAIGRASAQVLDVEANTLARVERYAGNEGLLLPIAVRSGFMRRGFDLSYVGDLVGATAAPVPVQALTAEAQLQQQLAMINARAAADAAVAAATAAGNVSAGLTSRDTGVGALAGSPLLNRVPPNAQVAIVGVYEGAGQRSPSGAPIRVSIQPSSTPLVLVLSSYESVQWLVQNSGRPVSAVLLAGYSPSTVIGAGNAPVLRIGSTYAYQLGSDNYRQLKQEIARYVPNRIDSFQGQYRGAEFSIPNQ